MDDMNALRDLGRELEHEPPAGLVRQRNRLLSVQKKKWFVPENAEALTFGVEPRARALCHFGQMNLLDEERTQLVGRCDVIFCRNVVLYFDAPARRRVIDMFYERLMPGGYLFLGHSESLLNVSTAFELVHLSEDLVYRKPVFTMPARPRSGSSTSPRMRVCSPIAISEARRRPLSSCCTGSRARAWRTTCAASPTRHGPRAGASCA